MRCQLIRMVFEKHSYGVLHHRNDPFQQLNRLMTCPSASYTIATQHTAEIFISCRPVSHDLVAQCNRSVVNYNLITLARLSIHNLIYIPRMNPTCSRFSSFSFFSRSSCFSNISCAAANSTAHAHTHPIVYSSSQSTRHSGHRFDVTMIGVGGIVGYEGY